MDCNFKDLRTHRRQGVSYPYTVFIGTIIIYIEFHRINFSLIRCMRKLKITRTIELAHIIRYKVTIQRIVEFTQLGASRPCVNRI